MFKLDRPFSNTDFVSIVILSFQRGDYTVRLLDSLHQHADFPFEVILVDDASSEPEVQVKLFQNLPKVTSLIYNTGMNRGFTNAANQATSLCSSDYIILLNNDIEMVEPAFKRIKSALAAPYLGCVGILGDFKPEGGPIVAKNGSQVELNSNPKGSGAFAFRKAVWEELGGFPERHHSAADIGFFYSLLKTGYFNGFIVNSPQLFRNVDQEQGYANPTEGTSQFANGYPRLFGVPKQQLIDESLRRKGRVLQISQADDKTPAGINNISYWAEWFSGVHENGKLLWGSRYMFGQDRWMSEIEGDLVHETRTSS